MACTSKSSHQTNIVLPNTLRSRILNQIELTGEKQSEFIRRCLLEKLEVLEAKQAEKRMMEDAVYSKYAGTES